MFSLSWYNAQVNTSSINLYTALNKAWQHGAYRFLTGILEFICVGVVTIVPYYTTYVHLDMMLEMMFHNIIIIEPLDH